VRKLFYMGKDEYVTVQSPEKAAKMALKADIEA
jgi:hypothetical protein